MRSVEIYRDGNEFYLKLLTDRWWRVHAYDNRSSWRINPFDNMDVCSPKMLSYKYVPLESEVPPLKKWSRCSRLDYLTVTARSLDKDIELIDKVVEEAWRSALAIDYIQISETPMGASVKVTFNKRNQVPKECVPCGVSVLMIDRNPDRVQLEWPY